MGSDRSDIDVIRDRLYAALKHEKSCVCGECSGGLNAVDDLMAALAEKDALLAEWESGERVRTETLTLIAAQGVRIGEKDAQIERLTTALGRVKDNAESWHGNDGVGTGHYRALNVIAQWCSEALGVTDEGDDR